VKKIFRKVHLWLAFPLGLIITVICLSGAVLVFRVEIEEALYPGRYFVDRQTADAEKLSLEQLAATVEAQLGEPAAGFTVPADTSRNYMVTLASNPRAPAYVNPYTGGVVWRADGGSFFRTMLSLHRWLLHPAVGKPVVGYATLLFVVILLTGIILVFPNTRKKWKRLLTVHLRKGWNRFWFDLHISAGVWVTIILLALALTGLTWSFRWYNTAFYRVLGAEAPLPRGHAPQQGGREQAPTPREQQSAAHSRRDARPAAHNSKDAQPYVPTDTAHCDWDALFHKIKHDNPDFKLITIRSGAVSVAQQKLFGNSRATDNYSFDAATGEITTHVPYSHQPRTSKIRGWIYSIHTGSWGGLFSKVITCLSALTGASLPLTGYYIFYKKRRRTWLSSRV
jgi:uncharacterized iron-regulated membrane protein